MTNKYPKFMWPENFWGGFIVDAAKPEAAATERVKPWQNTEVGIRGGDAAPTRAGALRQKRQDNLVHYFHPF